MTLDPFAVAPAIGLLAATPSAGYTLVNGTGNILQWTAPNDGKLHRVQVFAVQDVTVATTGGQILVSYTLPDGFATSHTVFAAGQAQGDNVVANNFSLLVRPNTTVTILQNTAMNPGAAVIWCELWGS